jgi:hypothetical protein
VDLRDGGEDLRGGVVDHAPVFEVRMIVLNDPRPGTRAFRSPRLILRRRA